jgi:hypothetical protein
MYTDIIEVFEDELFWKFMPNEQYLPNIHYYGNKTSLQSHEQYTKIIMQSKHIIVPWHLLKHVSNTWSIVECKVVTKILQVGKVCQQWTKSSNYNSFKLVNRKHINNISIIQMQPNLVGNEADLCG